jgi:predicted GNAT family acetyltransferase
MPWLTGLSGGMLGVFGVATMPEHRRRGIGAAITSFAVRDRTAEADLAVLWRSDLGYQVYERLGFRPVASWEVWVRKPLTSP